MSSFFPLCFLFYVGMTDKSNQNTKAKAAPTHYIFSGLPKDLSYKISDHKNELTVKIQGTPRPMYRHHARAYKTNRIQAYQPSQQNKNSFNRALKAATSLCPPHLFSPTSEAAVAIKLEFYFRRPQSHYVHTAHGLCVSPTAPTFVTKVPDVDNLTKLVLDALEGIVYDNDKCVSQIQAAKYWLYKPGDQFSISDSSHFSRFECTILKITQFKSNTYDSSCSCKSCSHHKNAQTKKRKKN